MWPGNLILFLKRRWDGTAAGNSAHQKRKQKRKTREIMREVQFDRLGQARVFQRSLQSTTKKGTGQLSQSLHSSRVLNSTRLYFSDMTS